MLGEPRFWPAMAAVAGLSAMASRLGTTQAALALAFALANDAVASVLFGATSPGQLKANCGAAGLLSRLSPAELAELRLIGASA